MVNQGNDEIMEDDPFGDPKQDMTTMKVHLVENKNPASFQISAE